MLIALTHIPSPALAHCELTFMPRDPIDIDRALLQHAAYCDTLRRCGAQVITLDGNSGHPDGVFVEDNLLVLDELAIATPMGVNSRRGEVALLADTIAQYRPVYRLAAPATLEGGDVLRLGRTIFIGASTRTNAAAIEQVRALAAPHGYTVIAVPVLPGCLHLKTGCTALDDRTVLINPAWIDAAPLQHCTQIAIDPSEPFAANVLRVHDTIIAHVGFPKTNALLAQRGYNVVTTDIGEFTKAEAGLTCMSVLFPHH